MVGCRVKVGKTQLVGTPLYGEPIPVAWGDGRAQSGWRPAETGAVAYGGRGVCVCVSAGWSFLAHFAFELQTWVKLGVIGSSRGNLAGSGEPGPRQA